MLTIGKPGKQGLMGLRRKGVKGQVWGYGSLEDHQPDTHACAQLPVAVENSAST